MDTAPASHDAVFAFAQLDRILQSPTFQGAERSRALLRFLVEQSVGEPNTLGSEALGRGDAYGRELLYRTDDHRLLVTTYSVTVVLGVPRRSREQGPQPPNGRRA